MKLKVTWQANQHQIDTDEIEAHRIILDEFYHPETGISSLRAKIYNEGSDTLAAHHYWADVSRFVLDKQHTPDTTKALAGVTAGDPSDRAPAGGE
jgi:hypothetical protein